MGAVAVAKNVTSQSSGVNLIRQQNRRNVPKWSTALRPVTVPLSPINTEARRGSFGWAGFCVVMNATRG